VYTRQLSRALAALGHRVEVMSGPPYPELEPGVPLSRLESLDLYRPEDTFRRQRPLRDAIDLIEFGGMCLAGFPEPLSFSLRAWRELSRRRAEFAETYAVTGGIAYSVVQFGCAGALILSGLVVIGIVLFAGR